MTTRTEPRPAAAHVPPTPPPPAPAGMALTELLAALEGERRTHAAAVRAGSTRQEATMREPSNPGDGPDLGKAARAEHAMTEAHAAELADIVIRCLDYAGRYEIPLGDILAVKMRYYNRTRALRHGGRTL